MKRLLFSAAFLWLIFSHFSLQAETTVDALEQELKSTREEREVTVSKSDTLLLQKLDSAAGNPAAAVTLYEDAGGKFVLPVEEPGTDTRRGDTRRGDTRGGDTRGGDTRGGDTRRGGENREPLSRLEERQLEEKRRVEIAKAEEEYQQAVFYHCALLRFALLFTQPKPPSALNSDWAAWLKNIPSVYKTIRASKVAEEPLGSGNISLHYELYALGSAPQGTWNLRELPKLYRETLLEPSRQKPTSETFALWDAYIQLCSLDAKTPEQWERVEAPALFFEKQLDQCRMAPTSQNVAQLVSLLKQYPRHPQYDEMYKKTLAQLRLLKDKS